MESTKELLAELGGGLETFFGKSPEQMQAFEGFVEAVTTDGALDAKTKELIAIACSIIGHCKWCIAYHVHEALEKGATEEEIREASWVAVELGGGIALAFHQLVERALRELVDE